MRTTSGGTARRQKRPSGRQTVILSSKTRSPVSLLGPHDHVVERELSDESPCTVGALDRKFLHPVPNAVLSVRHRLQKQARAVHDFECCDLRCHRYLRHGTWALASYFAHACYAATSGADTARVNT